MFLGESPGAVENVRGKPFVGPAGQELDKYIGQYRHRVYITNIIACRPIPGIGITQTATDSCRPRLRDILLSLESLRLVILLGGHSRNSLSAIGFLENYPRGWVPNQMLDMDIQECLPDYSRVYYTCHPSYILRRGRKGKDEWLRHWSVLEPEILRQMNIKP